jgi:hypothetical protein
MRPAVALKIVDAIKATMTTTESNGTASTTESVGTTTATGESNERLFRNRERVSVQGRLLQLRTDGRSIMESQAAIARMPRCNTIQLFKWALHDHRTPHRPRRTSRHSVKMDVTASLPSMDSETSSRVVHLNSLHFEQWQELHTAPHRSTPLLLAKIPDKDIDLPQALTGRDALATNLTRNIFQSITHHAPLTPSCLVGSLALLTMDRVDQRILKDLRPFIKLFGMLSMVTKRMAMALLNIRSKSSNSKLFATAPAKCRRSYI